MWLTSDLFQVYDRIHMSCKQVVNAVKEARNSCAQSKVILESSRTMASLYAQICKQQL